MRRTWPSLTVTRAPAGRCWEVPILSAVQRERGEVQAKLRPRSPRPKASGTAIYGTGPPVSGRVKVPEGASPAGVTIELRQLTGSGPERLLTTATTDLDGRWTTELPPSTRGRLVRAVFMGDAERPGVTSRPLWIPAPR